MRASARWGLPGAVLVADEVRASPQNGLSFLGRTEHLGGSGGKSYRGDFNCRI